MHRVSSNSVAPYALYAAYALVSYLVSTVLYLTRHKGFHILIDDKRINFEHVAQKKIVFCATINHNNSAHLDGTVEEVSEYAQLSATVPLDLSLWHCCLAHHTYATVQKMVNEDLAIQA